MPHEPFWMPLHCTHGSIYHCVTSYAAAAAVATAQVYQPSPPIQYGEKRCHSRHECSYCYYFSVFFCCIVRDINSPCINAELLLRVIGGKIHTAGALCCDMRQCTAGRHANMGSERDGEEKINRVRLNYAANKTIFIYFRVFFSSSWTINMQFFLPAGNFGFVWMMILKNVFIFHTMPVVSVNAIRTKSLSDIVLFVK